MRPRPRTTTPTTRRACLSRSPVCQCGPSLTVRSCGMLNGCRLGGATAHWAVATCVGLTLNRLLAPVAHAHLDKRRRA